MSHLTVGTKQIEVDDEGFLSNPGQWNEEVATELARREGIDSLSPEKRSILHFLRDYFRKNHSFPILRYVCKKVGAVSANCIPDEFVDPMKAWKIAGLPKPPQVFFTSFDGKRFFANPFY
jgi:tRNA 2-thiouridine synthesizing protein E